MEEDQKPNGDVLYPDVLTLIAERLKGVEDFEAFRLCCKLFSKAATVEDFHGWCLRRNVPYLMLPANEDSTECVFFSLAKEKVVAMAMLPEAKAKKWIQSQGWLLTVGTYKEKGLSLLQPFQHLEIKLPNQETFPDYGWVQTGPYEFIKKIVLSSKPRESSDFAAVVIYGSCRDLGFWKPGNSSWTKIYTPRTYRKRRRIYTPTKPRYILDVTYFDRQFFAIDSAGQVWACDVKGPNPTVGQYVVSLPCKENPSYIVDSSGMLLVATWRDEARNRDPGFDLFEVNTVTRTWEQIEDLRGKALFIGHSASLLTEATQGIKPDHIYYAGNALPLQDGGAWSYDLREQRMECLYQRTSNGPNRPLWVAPIF